MGDFRYSAGGKEGPFGELGLSLQDWGGHNRYEGKSGDIALAQIIATERAIRRPMKAPSLEHIKHLQRYGKKIIDQRLQEECFSIELPPITVHAFSTENMEMDGVAVLTITDRPEELFIHNVAILMIGGASRIRRCPECQQIFFADRKNKISCSARCQNTAAVRRLRQSASSLKDQQKTSKSSKTPKSKKLKKGEA